MYLRPSSPIPVSATATVQPLTQLFVVTRPPRFSSPTRRRVLLSKRVASSSTPTSSASNSSLSIHSFTPPSELPDVIPYSLPASVKHSMSLRLNIVSDEDEDENRSDVIYARNSTSSNLRSRPATHRINGSELKAITTTPGLFGAGETETESEEPRRLPTSRIIPSSPPLIPPNALQSLTPLLFAFSRWLSIVPAFVGVLYNVFCLYYIPSEHHVPRLDYYIATLWAILTGYQCLALTTGLLKRWRVYYSPLPTLIRLFALQAICWPATQFTFTILDGRLRPAPCWAVIGTTTCCSRSIQIWVTSNIIEKENLSLRKWGGRKWDWGIVGRQCALPAGILYFVWTWVLVIGRELHAC